MKGIVLRFPFPKPCSFVASWAEQGGSQTYNLAFAQKFGRYEKDAKLWALPAYLSSIMTSTPFLGKLIVRSSSPS